MKIKLNQNSSNTILERLERIKVPVESHCRSGICGVCRCKLVSGEIHYIEDPLAWLNEDEILICCATSKTNVEIEINEP